MACLVVGACGGDTETTAPPGATLPATTITDTPDTTPDSGGTVSLAPVLAGLDSPVQTITLPDAKTLWVVEQGGRVKEASVGGAGDPRVILDIAAGIASGGERGLLSLALHPTFPTDPRVYIHFSDPNGNTRVQERRFDGQAISTEPLRTLLEQDQPYSNHNGGSLAFGPDGKLYLGLGDGGSADDPEERAQDLSTKLGKLLRLDVDATGADWEIAAYGLRNPWRFAFDPETGDGWIGDVGQNEIEEVDVFPNGSPVLNFGWDAFEGSKEFTDDAGEIRGSGTVTPPVAEYTHADGCSITGGVVVRNADLSAVDGRYIFGDYCSGKIWTVAISGGDLRREPIDVPSVVSFDSAPDGNVLVTSSDGTVSRLSI